MKDSFIDRDDAPRKPRIALMGEFSAGKSTLTNVLLGRKAIPVRVTATNLPPVWITEGPDSVTITDHDGRDRPGSFEELATIGLEDAALIHVSTEADILTLCDIIDMPGISDPNMDEGVWTAMIEEIDSVLWCTHATQAWRQSEAGVWERTLPETDGRNLLLVSQIDKLTSDRDRERVLTRVRKETGGMFRAVMPLSLDARAREGDVEDVAPDSDLGRFLVTLVDMLLSGDAAPAPAEAPVAAARTEPVAPVRAVAQTAEEEEQAPATPAILPRRVPKPKKLRTRPIRVDGIAV